jgi:hypothetical protein
MAIKTTVTAEAAAAEALAGDELELVISHAVAGGERTPARSPWSELNIPESMTNHRDTLTQSPYEPTEA